jgi:enoyl-CoA hydratase/carnithine racemase
MTPFRGESLSFERVGDLLEVRLHRAPLNEIGLAFLADLEVLAGHLEAGAGGARALVLWSEREGGFSAGADLRELHAGMGERSPADQVAEVRRFLDRIHAVLTTLDRAPLPTVAAIHGVCFGGGLELALACDLRVADKTARFAFPELRLGLVPGFGGLPRLGREVGNAVVRDLLFTGRSIRAQRAHELGLVSQVVAEGRAVEVARSVAVQAARFDAATFGAAKRFVKPDLARELEEEKRLFCELFARPVVRDALQRFVGSREVLPYLP